MNKEKKFKDLLKKVEQKILLRNQCMKKEKELAEEIDRLLKDVEALAEELKKEKFR